MSYKKPRRRDRISRRERERRANQRQVAKATDKRRDWRTAFVDAQVAAFRRGDELLS